MRRMEKAVFQFSILVTLLFGLVFGSSAQQGGDKGLGGGQNDDGQLAERSSDRTSESDEEARDLTEKVLERMDQARHRDETQREEIPMGLEMQSEKKMVQEQKETGKGSEQGQQKREEHRRKWWKFWE